MCATEIERIWYRLILIKDSLPDLEAESRLYSRLYSQFWKSFGTNEIGTEHTVVHKIGERS